MMLRVKPTLNWARHMDCRALVASTRKTIDFVGNAETRVLIGQNFLTHRQYSRSHRKSNPQWHSHDRRRRPCTVQHMIFHLLERPASWSQYK